jgi:hypothetical protein
MPVEEIKVVDFMLMHSECNSLDFFCTQTVLQSAFAISEKIVGLSDPKDDIHFPIMLLSRAPNYVIMSLFISIAEFSFKTEFVQFSTSPYYELDLLPEEDMEEEEEGDDDGAYDEDEEEDDEQGVAVVPSLEDGSPSSFRLDASLARALLGRFDALAPRGALDRRTFDQVARSLSPALGQADRAALDALFDAYDRDGHGVVDKRAFQAGLSVLVAQATSGETSAVRRAFEVAGLIDLLVSAFFWFAFVVDVAGTIHDRFSFFFLFFFSRCTV